MNRYRFIIEDIREEDSPTIIAAGIIEREGDLELITKQLQATLPRIMANINARDDEQYEVSDVHLTVRSLDDWISSQLEHTFDLLKEPDDDD
jgi:hypothetical protein